MFRLSNIRIGIKLGVMSGIGILLVLGMIGAAMYSNGVVKTSNEAAQKRALIVEDAGHLELAFVNVRLAVRNIRLATTVAELNAANTLEARLKEADKQFEVLGALLSSPENRARAQTVQAAMHSYVATALKETVPVKTEALGLDPDKDAARIVALYAETQRIQHEDLDPGADKGVAAMADLQKSAAQLAAERAHDAEEQMASAETINIGIGAVIVLVLLGSAIFGAFTIARPLS